MFGITNPFAAWAEIKNGIQTKESTTFPFISDPIMI